jgi:hypothetical protein
LSNLNKKEKKDASSGILSNSARLKLGFLPFFLFQVAQASFPLDCPQLQPLTIAASFVVLQIVFRFIVL